MKSRLVFLSTQLITEFKQWLFSSPETQENLLLKALKTDLTRIFSFSRLIGKLSLIKFSHLRWRETFPITYWKILQNWIIRKMIEIYEGKFLMRRSCTIHQSDIFAFILNTFVFLRYWHESEGQKFYRLKIWWCKQVRVFSLARPHVSI